MVERIPIPEIRLFDISKRLRTLGGAAVHLFTRHLGNQPLASHGDHLPYDMAEANRKDLQIFVDAGEMTPQEADERHNRWCDMGTYIDQRYED